MYLFSMCFLYVEPRAHILEVSFLLFSYVHQEWKLSSPDLVESGVTH